MSKNENQFFDSKTIIAIGLVMLIWVGWQNYLTKKYPNAGKVTPAVSEKAEPATDNPNRAAETAAVPANVTAEQKTIPRMEKATTEEKLITIENENFMGQLSSKGMALKNIQLKKYTDRSGKNIVLGQQGVFALGLNGEARPLDFEIKKQDENIFIGTAKRGETTITQKLVYSPENNSFKAQIFIQKPDNDFKGIRLSIDEKKMPPAAGSFLMPSFEHQEFVVNHQGKLDRKTITNNKDNIDSIMPQTKLLAVGTQYFTTLIKDQSEIIPEAKTTALTTNDQITAELSYKPTTLKDVMELNWLAYVGPKSLTKLDSVDADFSAVVDFGFFNSIGRVLFLMLNMFFNFVGNWGVAIIILTIIVRLVVLPFNISSYRSMKKMQQIQPKIQSLRDRYKNDPQTLNAETMKLFKEEKVNPIGGCLPMLLQMPVFFALYQVLGQSIELYQAPFFGWIQDLSLKDPYFVLPILMGIAMWFQQKITPTTMDPTQAKIMQFLPIVFSLMMIALPSGLTLYIFVSTLFGIIQQQLFMKSGDKKIATGG